MNVWTCITDQRIIYLSWFYVHFRFTLTYLTKGNLNIFNAGDKYLPGKIAARLVLYEVAALAVDVVADSVVMVAEVVVVVDVVVTVVVVVYGIEVVLVGSMQKIELRRRHAALSPRQWSISLTQIYKMSPAERATSCNL